MGVTDEFQTVDQMIIIHNYTLAGSSSSRDD